MASGTSNSFATPWAIIQSMEFSRPEYCSGKPFPSPDLPNPGIKHTSPAVQVDSLPAAPPQKPTCARRALTSLFYMCCPVLPGPLTEEVIFAPLYILAFFVKKKVPIGAWIYFWAFYLVLLVYISDFVPAPYYLDDCSFVG